MLAGDRSAEPQRELEKLFGEPRRKRELVLVVLRQQERRVEIAVARVTPGARRDAQPPPDLERLLDRLAEPVERHCNVLARLAAALGIDDERQAVAPAPQRGDLLRRLGGVERQRVLAEQVEHVLADPRRLLGRAVCLDKHCKRTFGHLARKARSPIPHRFRIDVLQRGHGQTGADHPLDRPDTAGYTVEESDRPATRPPAQV